MSKSQTTSPCSVKDRGGKKKKRIKVRIALQDRLEALDLLAEGKTMDQVVKAMAKKHPSLSLEQVRTLYDPSNGGYSIGKFEGATKAEVEDKKIRLIALNATIAERGRKQLAKLFANPDFVESQRKWGRELMNSLHADPEFAAARDIRAREQIIRLNADPQFQKERDIRSGNILKTLHRDPTYAAANRKRAGQQMTRLHQNPEFIEAREAGWKKYWTPERRMEARVRMLEQHQDPDFIAARDLYWNTYRMRLTSLLEDQGIYLINKQTGKPNRWKTVGNILTPDKIAMSREKRKVVTNALSVLGPLEKQVIDLVILADQATLLTTAEASVALGVPEEEIELTLEGALLRLAENTQLQEIA